MEFNKLKIIKKILHNLGVIDLEKAVTISNEITEEELSSFLLIFPIDKSDLIEINENIKRMLSDKMLMQITKVLDVIFEQTGIELNENNKELLLLSDEEYVDYKEKVKALFANKDFYDEQKITEVINLIKVKHFKMFLKLYDSENEEKTTTVSIAKELGVSDTTVIRIFTKIKEIIKEKTGIEINKSSHEKRKIEETDEETYKRDFIEYFQMFGITSDSKLHALFSLIKQPEFRIFERAFPLDKKEKISQEKLAIYFNTPLTSLKKILQKIYGIIDELGIRFFENYYKNIEYYNLDNILHTQPKTEKERMNAIKVMYATNEITEIKRAIDELDPKKRRLILAIKPLDGKKGYAIKKYSNEFEIPRTEVVKKAKEAVIQIRENVQRIKVVLTKEEKDLILEIADTFDGISKKIILLFFGINNENRRYSIDEISQILSVSKGNISDILLEFLRLKNEILEDENKHQK